MNRVIVIGCPGSGKTTFSKKLNKITGLPLYHLDAIWHKPDKTHIPREEFDQRISEIFATDEWIIDGNYGRTVEIRLKECDRSFSSICQLRSVYRELANGLEKAFMICRG